MISFLRGDVYSCWQYWRFQSVPDLVDPLRKHILVVRVGRGTQQKQNCVFDSQETTEKRGRLAFCSSFKSMSHWPKISNSWVLIHLLIVSSWRPRLKLLGFRGAVRIQTTASMEPWLPQTFLRTWYKPHYTFIFYFLLDSGYNLYPNRISLSHFLVSIYPSYSTSDSSFIWQVSQNHLNTKHSILPMSLSPREIVKCCGSAHQVLEFEVNFSM